MDELFGRVLAHVPTPQLHESYNAVLHEEFASVSQTLSDVVAAFAKLQEVHDAVSKLQQSHDTSTDRRSDSARTLADNSMRLQQQLQRQVEELAAGMKLTQVERKRKSVRTDPPVRNSGRDMDEKEERGAASSVTAASGFESSSSSESESDDDDDGSDENSDEAEGSEVGWKELSASSEAKSEPSPANDAERLETDTHITTKSLKKLATHMKVIIEMVNTFSPLNRSFIIPEVLAALKRSVEEDVGGMQQSEVTASLKIVLSWGDRCKGYQVQHVESYREYAAEVESYVKRLPSSARASELQRLKDALCCMIKILEGCLTSGSDKTNILTAVQDAKKKYQFSQKMGVANTVPSDERIETLLRMLIAFKKETAANVSCTFGDRMIKVILKVSRWQSEDFHDPVQSLVHRIIVDAFREFSTRIPKVFTRNRVVKLLNTMSEGISDPSNPRTREQLTRLRNRATQVFKEVKQYQRKPISPSEAHKLTEAVRILVEDVTVGWSPHRDVTIRECVQELKNILVQAQASGDIKPRKSFKMCLTKIVKWNVEDPPAALEEERKRKRMDEEAATVPFVVTPARSKDGDEVRNDGAAKKAKRLEAAIGSDSDSSEQDMKAASVVKREVAAASSSDSSSSSETENDDSEDESDENEEEGSEAAWKALTTTGAGNSVKQPTGKLETRGEAEGTMTPNIVVDDSVTYMKTIVEEVSSMSPTERSFIIPDVLTALKRSVEEDIDGMHPNEVASSLNVLVGWWAGQCEDQIEHVKLYRELAAVVETYVVRLPISTQKSGLSRLLDCLYSAIKNLPAISERDSKRTTIRSDKKWGLFSNMVGMLNAQRHFRGKHRLLCVLVALRQETAAGVNDAFGTYMLKPIGKISGWLGSGSRQPLQLLLYRMLLNALRQLSCRISEVSTRDRVVRILGNMSGVIADPSNSEARKALADIRDRAAQVFQDVKQYKGISMKEIQTLMDAIGLLVNDVTIGWNSRRDATMRKCVKEFKTILVRAQASSSTNRVFLESCLGGVAHWMVEDPPTVVRAPTK